MAGGSAQGSVEYKPDNLLLLLLQKGGGQRFGYRGGKICLSLVLTRAGKDGDGKGRVSQASEDGWRACARVRGCMVCT